MEITFSPRSGHRSAQFRPPSSIRTPNIRMVALSFARWLLIAGSFFFLSSFNEGFSSKSSILDCTGLFCAESNLFHIALYTFAISALILLSMVVYEFFNHWYRSSLSDRSNVSNFLLSILVEGITVLLNSALVFLMFSQKPLESVVIFTRTEILFQVVLLLLILYFTNYSLNAVSLALPSSTVIHIPPNYVVLRTSESQTLPFPPPYMVEEGEGFFEEMSDDYYGEKENDENGTDEEHSNDNNDIDDEYGTEEEEESDEDGKEDGEEEEDGNESDEEESDEDESDQPSALPLLRKPVGRPPKTSSATTQPKQEENNGAVGGISTRSGRTSTATTTSIKSTGTSRSRASSASKRSHD